MSTKLAGKTHCLSSLQKKKELDLEVNPEPSQTNK